MTHFPLPDSSIDVSAGNSFGQAGVADDHPLLVNILNSHAMAIIAVGLQGQLLYANERGRSMMGLCPTDQDLPGLHRLPFQQVVTTGQPVLHTQHTVHRPFGQCCSVSVDSVPLHDASGALMGVVFSLSDISHQQRVEKMLQESEIQYLQALQQARELNQLKSRLISMMSHEFRHPMTVLRACMELLHQNELSVEQRDRYFEQMDTTLDSMTTLLDEMLLLGQTEMGQFRFQPRQVDLKDVCQELIEAHQFYAGNSYPIQFHYESDASPTYVDTVLLNHILSNLLSNAIKYSDPDSDIECSVRHVGTVATFKVQDYGLGIPQPDQVHLFETFHRASNVKHIPGTGLGLAIVRNCVDLHQGKIRIESEAGRGTIVTVTLPVSAQSLHLS